jgi:hypothetical protein
VTTSAVLIPYNVPAETTPVARPAREVIAIGQIDCTTGQPAVPFITAWHDVTVAGVPFTSNTMPPGAVVGRLGSGSGSAEAFPLEVQAPLFGSGDPGSPLGVGLPHFASMAALRAGTNDVAAQDVYRVGEKAYVWGFYGAFDGGGGLFYWDPASTAAVIAGMIEVPTGWVGAGRWRRMWDATTIHLAWMGVSSTSTAAFNVQALNDAFALATTVEAHAGNFALNAQVEIVEGKQLVSKGSLSVNGLNRVTKFYATAAMPSLFLLRKRTFLRGIVVDAARLATRCIYADDAQASLCSEVSTINALRDGIGFSGGIANNDFVELRNCTHFFCGTVQGTAAGLAFFAQITTTQKIVAAGTVAVTAGSSVVTGTGTNFMALGLRPSDPIRIVSGANVYTTQIATIDSATQITIDPWDFGAPFTATGCDWAIGSGSGVFHQRAGDNNAFVVSNPTIASCAAFGHQLNGLYGNTLVGGSWQAMGFGGVCIGDGNSGVVFASTLINPYFEDETSCVAQIWARACLGLTILEPRMRPQSNPQSFKYGFLGQVEGTITYRGTVRSLRPDLNVWAAPTGTQSRSALPAVPTVTQLGEAINALINDGRQTGPLR